LNAFWIKIKRQNEVEANMMDDNGDVDVDDDEGDDDGDEEDDRCVSFAIEMKRVESGTIRNVLVVFLVFSVDVGRRLREKREREREREKERDKSANKRN
jgi:hypothetical protein